MTKQPIVYYCFQSGHLHMLKCKETEGLRAYHFFFSIDLHPQYLTQTLHSTAYSYIFNYQCFH